MSSQSKMLSRKVFVGGLPFDATEEDINSTFESYGSMTIDWPRRHSSSDGGGGGAGASSPQDRRQTSGYVFLIYRKEQSVHRLLNGCKVDSGRYFMFMSTRNSCRKPVQVRPWRLSDYVYLPVPSTVVDPRNTVFIGGVPRPTRAIDIVEAFEKKYGRIAYASVDIDPELRYPKGAARIVFTNRYDYLKAMSGRFINLPHCGSSKRIDIKPYIIDEQECSSCNGERCNFRFAAYFCAEAECLQYYCEACWDIQHFGSPLRDQHLPYVRSGESTRQLPCVPHLNDHQQRTRHQFPPFQHHQQQQPQNPYGRRFYMKNYVKSY